MYEKAFITNGHVAWEIPPGRISRYFLDGTYIAPEGWDIIRPAGLPEFWRVGVCGELREREKEELLVHG